MSWLLSENLWRSKAWPRTDRTKIFIGDAVMTAGKAMFSEWDGREGDVLKSLNRITTDDVQFLSRYGMRDGEDPKEFRVANALREDRLIRVIKWIIDGAINGDFDTYLRQPKGGPLLRVEPTVWNTEDELKIFSDTRMRYHDKYWSPTSNTWHAYVFFERDAFEHKVAKLGNASLKVNQTELEALPTPLRIAVRLALENPDIAKLRKGIRDKLARSAWRETYPDADTESETYILAIAAVLAEPNIDVIRKQKEAARLRNRAN